MEDNDDNRVYQVVINDEEQYSVWLADREIPAGWRPVGPSGPRSDCLDYIDQVWTDMRPKSLRERMAARDARPKRSAGARG
jgi:MbtH protein